MSKNEILACIDDFERFVENNCEPKKRNFWNEGSDLQVTLKENTNAYTRLKIRPRVLRGNKKVVMTTTVLGKTIQFPVGISPTAIHKWAHPDGEIGTARAAASAGTVMILASYNNISMEEVASAAPNALLWAQTSIYKDRAITTEIIRSAEELGFGAIVVTVDQAVLGNRNSFKRKRLMNVSQDEIMLPTFVESYKRAVENGCSESLVQYSADQIAPSVSWEDFRLLCSSTHLPVVAKGILTAEDARLAVENGAKAILVSNHGGRQLDGVPATIDVLPEIVAAVGEEVEVYLDGGIRQGTDIFKALALGARAVFIGRPVIWGLAYNGEEGVKEVLSIYEKEFESAMFLAGAASIHEIEPSMVVRQSYYEDFWKSKTQM